MISDCGLYDNLSYHITDFTKVVNQWYVYICQSSIVSAGSTRNVPVVILILGESCLELPMEYYRSLFQYDLVAERFS